MDLQVLDGSSPPAFDGPDTYFTSAYGQAVAAADGTEWLRISAYDDGWQLPLCIRPNAFGSKDAASPYGYSGAYARADLSSVDQAKAWAAARTLLDDLGVVSLFLRHSPIVPQALIPEAASVVDAHPTFAIDLSGGAGEAWELFEGRARTAVRKARRLDVRVEVRAATDTDLEDGSPFRRLYDATMARRGASVAYRFTNSYYKPLLQNLGSRLEIATAVSEEDVVSSALILRHPGTAHYHLSGTSKYGLRVEAASALLWAVAEHAAATGAALFHLGGGVHPGDSLERFKRSFGKSRPLTFRASGVKVNELEYNRLSAGHTAADYFPPYWTG